MGKSRKIFDVSQGNPYEDGIDYDRQECSVWLPLLDQVGDGPSVSTIYHGVAKRLVRNVKAEPGQSFLDVGCGTGISTLELLLQHPEIFVLGLDESFGMLNVARYKFHKITGGGLLAATDGDKGLLSYWQGFRGDSLLYGDHAEFYLGRLEDIDFLPGDSLDGAIANQSLHWIDLEIAFGKLGELLKEGGKLTWNTASHFYDDSEFPSSEFAFRYNNFFRFVLDELSGRGIELKDYRNLARPTHSFDSIREISLKHGFETDQVAIHLIRKDLQIFIDQYVRPLIGQLIVSEVEPEELERITQEAIAKAVNSPQALRDKQHKYEINPIFVSTKK